MSLKSQFRGDYRYNFSLIFRQQKLYESFKIIKHYLNHTKRSITPIRVNPTPTGRINVLYLVNPKNKFNSTVRTGITTELSKPLYWQVIINNKYPIALIDLIHASYDLL